VTTGARIVPRGDSALVLELQDSDPLQVNARAVAIADVIREEAIAGVLDVVPTFETVAVYFEPLKADIEGLHGLLTAAVAKSLATPSAATASTVLHRIPVAYGGSFGPDLVDVASAAGLTEEALVSLHSTPVYRVFMLGFIPGFAYMGPVDPAIAVPRRTTPRAMVPAGSVGIAGTQTGIYPADSPGGWHVIGRTSVLPFDPDRLEPFLFKAGDRVQFYAVASA
jgi:KipI family sensor histidine kinase inhibitor